MNTVLLIIHLFVTLALIGVVLIQRSEGGGLGIGSSQGMGAFMSGRGTANLLTRMTAILATVFMLLALALAVLNRGVNGPGHSLLDIRTPAPVAPAPLTPAPSSAPTPASPTAPTMAPATVPTPGKPAAPAASAPAPGPTAPAKPTTPSVPTN